MGETMSKSGKSGKGAKPAVNVDDLKRQSIQGADSIPRSLLWTSPLPGRMGTDHCGSPEADRFEPEENIHDELPPNGRNVALELS